VMPLRPSGQKLQDVLDLDDVPILAVDVEQVGPMGPVRVETRQVESVGSLAAPRPKASPAPGAMASSASGLEAFLKASSYLLASSDWI
jgi:hypothetical protein